MGGWHDGVRDSQTITLRGLTRGSKALSGEPTGCRGFADLPCMQVR